MSNVRAFSAVILFLVLSAHGAWAEVSALLRKLKPIDPCPAAVAAAKEHHIPLERIDAPKLTNALVPGDSATALITLCGKNASRKQWLVYMEALQPTAKERSAKRPPPMTLYSSFGGKFDFVQTPASVKLATLGPFVMNKSKASKAEEKDARCSVDASFLGLGFDKAAALICRLKGSHEKGHFDVAGAPFPESDLAKGRKLAAELKLTAGEERSLVAAVPAMLSYLGVVSNTEGLNDILSELVELPSAWSILRHGGVNPDVSLGGENLAPAETAGWSVPPGAPLFYLPLSVSLNKEPALQVTLVVTSPQPPLLICGGVVGLLAEKIGDNDSYMTLRIISARHQLKMVKAKP